MFPKKRFVFPIACSLLLLSASFGNAGDDTKIENRKGFETAVPGEHFRAYWESLKDSHKMSGPLEEQLSRDQIDLIIMLEVNIAVAADPKSPSLQDELFRFMIKGNRFDTGSLPEDFDKSRMPRKHLVGLIRTKQGKYGLITLYREFAVIELNVMVGIAPLRSKQ